MTDIINKLKNMGPSDLLKSETKKEIVDYLRPQYMATNDTPDDYYTIYTIISDAMAGKGTLKRQAESMLTKLNTELLREARTAQKTALQAQERAEKIKEKAAKNGLRTVSLSELETEASPFDIVLESDVGDYRITQSGIYKIDNDIGVNISRTPLIIDAQYDNPKTGVSRYRIKYGEDKAGDFYVKERIVTGAEIADSHKLVGLSEYGLGVDTNNVSEVIRYINAYISNNRHVIPHIYTIGKFGWLNLDNAVDNEDNNDAHFDLSTPFVPYKGDYEFDGAADDFFTAARSRKGNKDDYLDMMRKVRARNRPEVNLSCAAALASVLLKPLNVVSFIMDLYGTSTFGKSLAYIIALSQYGDPLKLKSVWMDTNTKNGVMAKLSISNNIAVWFDDHSTLSDKVAAESIQPLIYAMANEAGGNKSNKQQGLSEQKTWRCVVLTNGEQEITRFVTTTGAKVRCLEIKCGDGEMYDEQEASRVASFFTNNHGHVIRDYLEIIQDVGLDYLMALKEEYMKEIRRLVPDIHSKQVAPLAVILTADTIATDYIYKDGIYLVDTLNRWAGMLAKRKEVDMMQGTYDTIMDILASNPDRLHIKDGEGYDQWGYQDGTTGNYLLTYSAFKKIVAMTDTKAAVDFFRAWLREHDKLVLLPETYTDKSGGIHVRSAKQRDLKPTFVNGSIRNIGMLEIKNRTQYNADDVIPVPAQSGGVNPFTGVKPTPEIRPMVPPTLDEIYQSAVQAQEYADKHVITDVDAYLAQTDTQEYWDYIIKSAC